MKKRLLNILVITILTTSLVACGKSSDKPNTNSKGETKIEASTKADDKTGKIAEGKNTTEGSSTKNSTVKDTPKETEKVQAKDGNKKVESNKETEKPVVDMKRYSEELKYLPILQEMKIVNYAPASKAMQSNIVYNISNMKVEAFLDKYEALLHKEGWKTSINNRPDNIMVEKAEHQAVIIPQASEKDVRVLIMTK